MFHVGMGPKSGIDEIINYSSQRGVVTQAYSSLGNTPWTKHANPDILSGNVTTTIAKNHDASTVEVALKYVVDHGVPAVTKSANPKHLQSNLNIFSWNLTDDEHTALDEYVLPGN